DPVGGHLDAEQRSADAGRQHLLGLSDDNADGEDRVERRLVAEEVEAVAGLRPALLEEVLEPVQADRLVGPADPALDPAALPPDVQAPALDVAGEDQLPAAVVPLAHEHA